MDQHLIELVEQLRIDFESSEGDVEISVGGQKFNASKYVLCLRSPVFNAMFKSDTKEKQTNIVEINEFDAELVEKFLLYMYTAKIDNLNEISMEMFKIADYYDVKLLKETCLEQMLRSVNKTNVIDYFELADRYSLEDLKIKTTDFLVDNIDKSTMFIYYVFAKSYALSKVENGVIDFIGANLEAVSITSEWQKFDFDFRLKILQEFFDQGPMLRVLETTKSQSMLPSPPDQQSHQTKSAPKCYMLKNIGKKRLYFTIEIVSQNGDAKVYDCQPNNGYIEPNKSQTVLIHFKEPNFHTLITYKTAGKKNRNESMDQNALVRQIKINAKRRHISFIQ